jgi:uncharacterized protein YdeI (YjbR/CyaY-like superfamily)
MTTERDLPILELADRHAWELWLEFNHESSSGVWLKLAKRGAASATVAHGEALEEALRYGWIDGQAQPCDESFWLVRFTPRRPRSKWSQNNREKAMRLIEQGRMKPAGHAAIEAAKADGRWEAAYPPQATATVPEDFQRELDRKPEAKDFFEKLTGANRYAFLYRLHHVRKPETRAERIASYVAMLEQRKTFQP